MKTAILGFVILLSLNSYSQKMYAYYNGYIEGFRKGCGCSNKPPKASDLYYQSGTYEDGYSDGRIDGRIFLKENSDENQETDLYDPNLELVERALRAKQERLDKHKASLNELRGEYNSLLKANIDKLSESEYQRLVKRANNFKQFLAKADLSVYENYLTVFNYLNDSLTLLKSYL